MKSRSGKALIQLAAIVFMLNTTTAYGACCFMFAAGEPASEELPCHKAIQKDKEQHLADAPGAGNADMPSDCCLMCVPMLAQTNLVAPKFTQPVTSAQSDQPSAKHSTDPPFRPPISYPV